MKIRDRIKSLQRVAASELRPNPRNWRRHPKEQRSALRAVLAEIGFADALLVRECADGSFELIDGHLRADQSGTAKIPVLVTDLSESEAAKLLALHDPLAAMAETDAAKLNDLLTNIDAGTDELAQLLDSLTPSTPAENTTKAQKGVPTDSKKANALAKKWNVRCGQRWQLGEHLLVCGDSTDISLIHGLKGERAWELTVTDPPYEIDATTCSALLQWCGPLACVLAADKLAFQLGSAFDVRCDRIWLHRQPRKLPTTSLPIMYHAHILTLADGEAKTGWRKPTTDYGSVIRTEQEYATQHGHGKSSELFCRMMDGFPQKRIVDPFAGSGAGLIACEQTGRHWTGIEKEAKWAAVAIERAAAYGIKPQLVAREEVT